MKFIKNNLRIIFQKNIWKPGVVLFLDFSEVSRSERLEIFFVGLKMTAWESELSHSVQVLGEMGTETQSWPRSMESHLHGCGQEPMLRILLSSCVGLSTKRCFWKCWLAKPAANKLVSMQVSFCQLDVPQLRKCLLEWPLGVLLIATWWRRVQFNAISITHR